MLQAWLTLLPAVVLAWPGPGAVLRDVPTTLSAATGWVALASLPAALFLAARRTHPGLRGTSAFLVLLLVAELAAWAAPLLGHDPAVADTFAARRARLGLWTALALTLSGASLGARGRVVLVRGLALLSLAWTLPALTFDRPAGVLGNSGDLSEAALPGALLGLGVFLERSRRMRWVGLAAVLAYVLYAGTTPVLAGALGFLVAVGCALGSSLGERTLARHARLGIVAALLLVAPYTVHRALDSALGSAGPESVAPSASAAPTSGIEVRFRIWRRIPALAAAHSWTGAGPGQFAAAFPPHRDHEEIEISSHRRREPTPIEVEHAHNDWIEGFAEYGPVGGGAWVVLLVLVLARAVGALRGKDATRASIALAAIGVCANAVANGPLLAGVASPAVAFPLFGALLAATSGGRAARSRARPALVQHLGGYVALLLPAIAAVALMLRAPDAVGFVRHGAALARLADSTVVVDGLEKLLPAELGVILEDALSACPDSLEALTKRAQLAHAREDPEQEELAAWERVLDLRPFRFEALLAVANLHARQQRFRLARDFYERAQRLDPESPLLLQNRIRLALDSADSDLLRTLLREWERAGPIDREWLLRSGAEQLLRGRPGLGYVLLRRFDPEYEVLDADISYQLGRRHQEAGDRYLANALLANAYLLMARQHIEEDQPAVAVRTYRQSVQFSRDELPGGAAALWIELAAAQVLARKPAEAAATLEGVEPTALDLRDLPAWAARTLGEAGLLDG